MNFFKNFSKYAFVFLFLLIIPTFHLLAQEQSEIDNMSREELEEMGFTFFTQEELNEINNNISVRIENISVNNQNLSPGDSIEGSFTITNLRNSRINNLSYTISTVGNFDGALFGDFYDTQSFNNINLLPQESKNIEFAYNLPIGIAGDDLALQIQAFSQSGEALSWADHFINVVGGESFDLDIIAVSLNVDEIEYRLQDGPTIKEGQEANLNLVIENNSDIAQQLYPTISIFDRNISGRHIKDISIDPINVEGNDQFNFIWDIDANLEPGVYEASLVFKNEIQQRFPLQVNLRFIIGGSIASIQNVRSNIEYATKGEIIPIIINYTGTPFDLESTLGNMEPNILNIDITIMEEENLVASYSGNHDFNEGMILNLELESRKNSGNATIDILVRDNDGNIITQYAGILFDYDGLILEEKSDYTAYIISGIILLIIIIFIIVKSKSKTLVLLAMFLLSFNTTHAISEVVWTEAYALNNYLTTFILTSPPKVMSPGQEFAITGTLNTLACNNAPQDVRIRYSEIHPSNIQGSYVYTRYTDQFDGAQSAREYHARQIALRRGNINHINFIAPNEPGIYRIRLEIAVRALVEHQEPFFGNHARSRGYIEFEVVAPEPVDGKCGIAADDDARYYSDLDENHPDLCRSGVNTVSNFQATGDDPTVYTWDCLGSNGGADDLNCENRVRHPFDEPGDPDDTEATLSCLVQPSQSGNYIFDTGERISVDAVINSGGTLTDVEYTWEGSFTESGDDYTDGGSRVTNVFSEPGVYTLNVIATSQGRDLGPVQCMAGQVDDQPGITVANIPDITFSINPSLAKEDGMCTALWSVTGGDEVSCQILNELNEVVQDLGLVSNMENQEIEVQSGNEYRLRCITEDETQVSIITDAYRCVDPNLQQI